MRLLPTGRSGKRRREIDAYISQLMVRVGSVYPLHAISLTSAEPMASAAAAFAVVKIERSTDTNRSDFGSRVIAM